MAIEQAQDTENAADAASPSPEESSEDVAETLPDSLLAGKTVKPGDVVRIEVVGIDPENGTWQGRYASSPAPIRGDNTISDMAAQFKPAKQEMS